ncbi:hypothetical protein FACS1894195_0440 [Bacteroidia bacterium]|nr:hypothetical protein FACS1894195_0440 [Bacteroidia bacterium]
MKILLEKQCKARKQHRCQMCNLPINVGDVYNKIVYIYDSVGFCTHHEHLDCVYLIHKLFDKWKLEDGINDADFKDAVIDKWMEITNTNDFHSHPDMQAMIDVVLKYYRDIDNENPCTVKFKDYKG